MPVDVLTRTEKGSILVTAEMDQNLTDLQDAVNIARVETTTETSVTLTAGSKRVILADATAASMVITLPPAADALDEIYYVKKVDSTTNTVMLEGDTVEEIDRELNYPLRDVHEGIAVISDGTEWFIISNKSNAPLTLGVKTDTTTVTNTTTETLLFSYTFNANAFSVGEKVIAETSGAYSNASPNDDFNIVVKLNGFALHTLERIGAGKTDAGWKVKVEGTIRSIGETGTYVDIAGLSDGDNIFTEASTSEVVMDTTGTVLYEVYIQWDNAKVANTFSCTQGRITVIK